jgi:hypothetical protein
MRNLDTLDVPYTAQGHFLETSSHLKQPQRSRTALQAVRCNNERSEKMHGSFRARLLSQEPLGLFQARRRVA